MSFFSCGCGRNPDPFQGSDSGPRIGAVFRPIIINELETSYRGPYTGSVGIFGFDNRATLNIIIRTFIHQNGTIFLPVGSGIVHDSSPELEYEETLSKARALVQAINLALSDPASLE